LKIDLPLHTDAAPYVISILGVLFSAFSGALAAGRKRFDWLGVVVISMVTALGGGTCRDVLLGRFPVFWNRDPNFIWASLAASAFALIYVHSFQPPRTLLSIADALGLAFFTISGEQISIQMGAPAVVVVLMGAVTGSAGGVLRDVLTGEVPLLFQQGELYATASLAGGALYLWTGEHGLEKSTAAIVGMLSILVIRSASILWRIRLPVFQAPDES
jgi:uncharacterized membrane protein YeiH